MKNRRYQLTLKRKIRVRGHLKTSLNRPRLSVYRSNAHIYAQIIDDKSGTTLVSASDYQIDAAKPVTKSEKAALVGKLVAEKAQKAKITSVAFDRGSYKYHGRIKALAQAAREQGLKF